MLGKLAHNVLAVARAAEGGDAVTVLLDAGFLAYITIP